MLFRDIAEPLMGNVSFVQKAKRWCCYCKEEQQKGIPVPVAVPRVRKERTKGRAKGSLLLSPGNTLEDFPRILDIWC